MPRRKAAVSNNDAVPKKKSRTGRGKALKLPQPTISKTLGIALTCGQGDMGQLGLGENVLERKKPALIASIKDVVEVCAGGMHNLCLNKDGEVYSFGCNDEGALGRDSSEEGSDFEPKIVSLPGKCVKISAGDSHSACLMEDGRVFAWGSFRDSHGNMGLTLEGNKRIPIDVLPGIQACDIASGADHLVILVSNGNVYTVGCGEQGQLGRVSLRSASGESRRGKSQLLKPGLVAIKHTKPIDAIWATTYCTFVREKQTSIIFAFGLNNYKQLAYPKDLAVVTNPIDTKFKDVKTIAGGQHHTLVLKTDGSCYAIGRRDYGRLGLENSTEDVKQLERITSLDGEKVVSISCGEAQSFAITDDGKLYSWGMGSNHQLGTGTENDALKPTLIVSKETQGKRVIQASGGGQHSIFLVAEEMKASAKGAQSHSSVSKENAKENITNTITADEEKENKVNGEAVEDAEEDVFEIKEQPTVAEKTPPKKGRKKK